MILFGSTTVPMTAIETVLLRDTQLLLQRKSDSLFQGNMLTKRSGSSVRETELPQDLYELTPTRDENNHQRASLCSELNSRLIFLTLSPLPFPHKLGRKRLLFCFKILGGWSNRMVMGCGACKSQIEGEVILYVILCTGIQNITTRNKPCSPFFVTKK